MEEYYAVIKNNTIYTESIAEDVEYAKINYLEYLDNFDDTTWEKEEKEGAVVKKISITILN